MSSHDDFHVRHVWQDRPGGTWFCCYTSAVCPTADHVCHLDPLIKVTLVGEKWKWSELTPACAEICSNSFITHLSRLHLDSHLESATSGRWSYSKPPWEIQPGSPASHAGTCCCCCCCLRGLVMLLVSQWVSSSVPDPAAASGYRYTVHFKEMVPESLWPKLTSALLQPLSRRLANCTDPASKGPEWGSAHNFRSRISGYISFFSLNLSLPFNLFKDN